MPWLRWFGQSPCDNGTTATATTTIAGNVFWATLSGTTTAASQYLYPATTTIYAPWPGGATAALAPPVQQQALSGWHHQAALNQAQLAQAQNMQRELARQGPWGAINHMLPQPPQLVPEFQPVAPPILRETAEQAEQRRARFTAWEAARAARTATAEATARALLLRFLDDEQALEFERTKSFIVIGKSGARYRIRWGKIANIDIVDNSRAPLDPLVGRRLCVHPADAHILPVPDVMLAQLLHLRANDAETRRIANVH